MPIAVGADHDPSGRRAITSPEPPRAVLQDGQNAGSERGKPIIHQEPNFYDGDDSQTFRICQDGRRDDLIRAKGLLWIDKRRENSSSLAAFTPEARRQRIIDGHRRALLLPQAAMRARTGVRVGRNAAEQVEQGR